MSFFVASPRSAAFLQLSDLTFTSTESDTSWNNEVACRMDNNGSIIEIEYNFAEFNRGDFVVPTAYASLVEARVTSVSFASGHGSDWFQKPAADGTWVSLATDKEWSVKSTTAGTDSTTAVMELRWGSSGSAIVTANYTWRTVNETP
jgi:hypothetical protein